MKEIWKPLKGVVANGDNYAVSTEGRVKNITTGRVLKWGTTKKEDGYLTVCLNLNGTVKGYTIHKLVATAFIPTVKGKDTVNHKDGNKLNNVLTNLEWASREEQGMHATRTGLRVIKAHKPVEQVNLKGEVIATFPSGLHASRATGLNQSTINSQCLRNTANKTKFNFYFRYATMG